MHTPSFPSFLSLGQIELQFQGSLAPPVATADAANETQANSVKSFIRSVDLEGRRDWFASKVGGSMLTKGSHRGELIN